MPRWALEYTTPSVLGITSFKGINMPWLLYLSGGGVNDGYSNGFIDYYFNSTGANADMQARLDVLEANGFNHVRLFLEIFSYPGESYGYMSLDSNGNYNGFQNNFLTNLATYCDWCTARNIKLLITIDDAGYCYPWSWLSSTTKTASYIQAVSDLVNAIKNKPSVWGFDYANEPYDWVWVTDTTVDYGGTTTDYGIDRYGLTTFFGQLYTTIKGIMPNVYCSVGSSSASDDATYGIANVVDFFQVHYYGSATGFTEPYSDRSKPVIVGEFGDGGGGDMFPAGFCEAFYYQALQLGYPLAMGWYEPNILANPNGPAPYQMRTTIPATRFNQQS